MLVVSPTGHMYVSEPPAHSYGKNNHERKPPGIQKIKPPADSPAVSLKINKYINPKIDWAVKRLFGKGNEIFLKSLLDAILEGEQKTDSLITYLDKEHTGETFEDRTSIFDLLARDSKQQNFLIESQISYQEFFMKRVVFYLSKFVSTEGKKGEWDFNFNPTTAVCITDFDYPEGKDYPNDTRYIKRFGLFDKQTLDPILEDCSIIIVDLKNFNKSDDELETMLVPLP